jgi:hypothetical protein
MKVAFSLLSHPVITAINVRRYLLPGSGNSE